MKPFFLCFYFSFLLLATQQSETSACTEEIRAFVDGHNSRRLQVASGKVNGQPGASEMKLMIWDPELQSKAKAWADRHDFNHNPDRTIPSGRFETGENLYLFSTTDRNFKLNPDQVPEAWFSEHRDYVYGPLPIRDGSTKPQIGHYTQLVWSDSIYIGCAISKYFENERNNFLVVCNYGPPGNYISEVPYNKGGPSRNLTCGCAPNDSECDCNKLYGGNCYVNKLQCDLGLFNSI